MDKTFDNRNYTLMTDLYELTMMQGYFNQGRHETAIFDVFYRTNPSDGGYAICCGLESVVDYIKNLKFTDSDIEYLAGLGIFGKDFLDYLHDFRFTGSIYAIPEGTVIHPMEPLLKVIAPIDQAQLVETTVLCFINHQSLIATKASRVCYAANGDPIMEFGLRRAQGADAGTYGARAAVIGGCAGTSNVLCGKYWGIPVLGTHAHSWIMSFPTEYDAFLAYAEMYPQNATLLVDTYNTLKSGVPNAIKVFKKLRAEGKMPQKYGIRLDSGDLAYLSKQARKMLDAEGFTDAIICASNDLDEWLIKALKGQGCMVNTWGVGTNLITSKDCPSFGGVYKMAAVEKDGKMVPKIKLSENTIKITNPDNKTVYRIYNNDGMAIADLIALANEPAPAGELVLFDPKEPWKKTRLAEGEYTAVEIMVPVFVNGECVYELPTVKEIKEKCEKDKAALWEECKRFENPHTYYVDLSKNLYDLKMKLLEEESI